KGQILPLPAPEAAECGLAGVAADMNELGNQVCGGVWHEVNRRAWNATLTTVTLQRQREREQYRKQRLLISQRIAVAQAKPELDAIERRVTEQLARGVAAQRAINDLTARYNRELERIKADEQKSGWTSERAQSNPKRGQLQKWYDTNVAPHRTELDAAAVEIALLKERHKRLLATVPTE